MAMHAHLYNMQTETLRIQQKETNSHDTLYEYLHMGASEPKWNTHMKK